MLFSPKTREELGFAAVAESAGTQIVEMYNKATIPTETHTRVVQMIQSFYNSYIALK